MAKNMRESDGFSNMFASLGFGANIQNEKSEKPDKKESDRKDNKRESVSEKKSEKESKVKDSTAGKDSEKTVENNDGTFRNNNEKQSVKKTIPEEKNTAETSVKTNKKPFREDESSEPEGAKKSELEKKSSEPVNTEKTEKNEEPADKTEEPQNENTSVRLYARNKKYFEIRAAQLGVSQMEYINFLLEDEEEREKDEDLDPFSIELPKKESTSIKALVLTKHNMEFLRSASSHLGMKMTQFINWMLDNERNREKAEGPRKSIE